MQDRQDPGSGGAGCLVRLYWMLLGNAIQWFLLALILSNRLKFPSGIDALYWVIVGSLLLARYVDIRYQHGQTAYGDEPATLQHWRRYAVLLVVVALGGWVGAHLLGHWLR